MKNIILIAALSFGIIATAQVKIGDNPINIGASSLLEIESPSKALVVTRVTSTAAVANPVNGMIVYDLIDNRFKIYQNNTWINLFL